MTKKKTYSSIFTAEQIDEILSRGVSGERLTLAEYQAKLAAGEIKTGGFYRIYDDQEKSHLVAIYDGPNLFLDIQAMEESMVRGAQLTQAEYDALKSAGKLEYGCWYRIYGDQRKQKLLAIYDGYTLVATRDSSKRRGFPLVFPFTFGS